jgi:hypothetical protein
MGDAAYSQPFAAGRVGLSERQAKIRAVAKPKKRRGFTPFRAPTSPPPGTYDPTLDASVRASGRGLNDLNQDTERDNSRSLTDYVTGQNRIDQNTGYSLADLLRGSTRETADYGTQTAGLQRQFQNLASSQADQANAAGVSSSGWAAQAARKRQANEALAQQGLDTAHSRSLEDSGINVGRTNTGADQQRADLTLGYQRGGEDRQTTATRATRENQFYASDVGDSKWFQAAQVGYVPPSKPANEHQVGNVTYRTLGGNRTVSADGTVRTRSQLQALLRRRGYVHG